MSTDYRVLVVDDQVRLAQAIMTLLKGKYILASAQSGEEALEMIPNFRPDLILLDIVMEGIDGYEVCRRIRLDKRFGLTKIVLVSGRNDIDERLKGYEAGADDYLTKPFEKEELKAKVSVFLRLKRAEEVDQIKGDLIGLFSHETKTPISGIIGFSSMIKKNKSASDEIREYADLIHQCGIDLLEFVKKTALLCELKSGKTLQLTQASLFEHLRAVARSIEEKAGEKRVVVDLEVDKDLFLTADWNLLVHMFGYILDNAVKYSPHGGSVRIWTEKEQDMYNLRIQDKGDGIDPEWIEKIFDEFAIRDFMHHTKGQGLSLAIAKRIVELHRGAIRAESVPGGGATFTVSLPLN